MSAKLLLCEVAVRRELRLAWRRLWRKPVTRVLKGNRKLSARRIEDIRLGWRLDFSTAELAEHHGVSQRRIQQLVKGVAK